MRASVLIPAFNAAHTLHGAIASVADQGLDDIEICVVDDGSTDATLAIAQDHGARVFSTGGRRGPGAARNLGLQHARGDWIAVLDADDRFLPERLSDLIRIADHNACDIVCDNLWVQEDIRKQNYKLHIDERLDGRLTHISFVDFFTENMMFGRRAPLGYLKPVFNRAFIEKVGVSYPEEMPIGEDFGFVAHLLARGAVFLRQQCAGYVYSRHQGSTSYRITPEKIDAMIDFDDRFLAQYRSVLTKLERECVLAHRRALERGRIFTQALNCAKSGNYLSAGTQMLLNPDCWALLRLPLQGRLLRKDF